MMAYPVSAPPRATQYLELQRLRRLRSERKIRRTITLVIFALSVAIANLGVRRAVLDVFALGTAGFVGGEVNASVVAACLIIADAFTVVVVGTVYHCYAATISAFLVITPTVAVAAAAVQLAGEHILRRDTIRTAAALVLNAEVFPAGDTALAIFAYVVVVTRIVAPAAVILVRLKILWAEACVVAAFLIIPDADVVPAASPTLIIPTLLVVAASVATPPTMLAVFSKVSDGETRAAAALWIHTNALTESARNDI